MKTQTKAYIGAGIAGAAALGALLSFRNTKPSRLETDLNQDGKADLVFFNKEGHADLAFIQKNDGSYDKCRVVINDGIPFYATSDGRGFYGPWGDFLENNAEFK